MPTKELHDNFPKMLDSIIDSLAHGQENAAELKHRNDIAREHAELRVKNPDYTMEAVMEEFRSFRGIMFDKLNAAGVQACDEIEIVSTAMFNAVTVSATLFSEEQREKVEDLVEELRRERERTKLFIAALTHDIRQPLSVARYSAEILVRKPESVESLVRIRASIERIAEMVSNLLDVVSTGAGKLPLKLVEVRPTELIARLLNEHRASHGDRFVYEFDNTAECMWDERQVSRALNNLIENAIKYGDEFSPITITLSHSGGLVSISVHNFGEPIPASELPALFDPFRRTTKAERSGVRGWGLGLAVVKAVAEAHGGSISVESTKEAGTRFTLTLPRTAER